MAGKADAKGSVALLVGIRQGAFIATRAGSPSLTSRSPAGTCFIWRTTAAMGRSSLPSTI